MNLCGSCVGLNPNCEIEPFNYRRGLEHTWIRDLLRFLDIHCPGMVLEYVSRHESRMTSLFERVLLEAL